MQALTGPIRTDSLLWMAGGRAELRQFHDADGARAPEACATSGNEKPRGGRPGALN